MTPLLATISTAVNSVGMIFAGIGWEPEIRGALTVAVGCAVLMGSIWLILVTNSGVRLGSLIAIAGFFGWMFLMGIIWWIYGIGWVGSSPRWEVKEFVTDPPQYQADGTSDAVTGPVGDLPDTNCALDGEVFPPTDIGSYRYSGPASGCLPRAAELIMAFPEDSRESLLEELLNAQDPSAKIAAINDDGITGANEVFAELMARSEAEIRAGVAAQNSTIPESDSRFKNEAELAKAGDALVVRRNNRIDDLSLSSLAATAPYVMEWADGAGYLDYGGWNLMSTAQSGEAVATADAEIREVDIFDGHDFIVLDSFQQGGKPLRDGDGTFDRVWHKITSTARITHPTNYAVVQAQLAIEKEVVAGELPPQPEINPEAATVSVVMERNLGNLRLIPALTTIVSLLFFLASCLALHLRDLTLQERLAGGPSA